MDKINQCFALSLATSSIFFSPGYVISGLSTRDACMVWEKNNRRVRDKKCTALSHILLPRPIAILKKINKITRSAMVAHSLKDNTTSVTLSIEHQPSSAVVVVINSCVYWNLLTCYWAPIIQWKLCNVVPALFVRKAMNCDVTGYKACGSLILKQTSRQNHKVVHRFRSELRHGSSTVFGLQYSGKKLNKNLR